MLKSGNIRLISISTSGIPELQDTTLDYLNALKIRDSKAADRIQKKLETQVARSTGSTLVQGKLGKQIASDFILTPNSPLLKFFQVDQTSEGVFTEFKAAAGASKGTKIGQLTVRSQKELFIQGQEEGFSAQSVKQAIFGKRTAETSASLTDLDPEIVGQTDITNRVFDFYFKKDPRLKKLFYEKASIMILNNAYSLDGANKTRLIGLQIPFSKFNSTFFKATLDRGAIVIAINDSFQKKLFEQINNVYLKSDITKKVARSVTLGKKNYKIDFFPALEGSQVFGAEVTNSIAVRPVDTFNLIAPISQKKEQTPSVIDITILVRNRVRLRMRRGMGVARPPKIFERSGVFRTSIEAYVNYKQGVIDYLYLPYYDSLERYGYEINTLVEGSIRDIAQKQFNRQFLLRRQIV